MRKLATGAVTLVALGFAFASPAHAVVLVDTAGQPVGGQWQRFVSEMRVPTIAGPLTFSTDAATACGGAVGCSAPRAQPFSQPALFIASGYAPGAQRDTLYFELGHEFDWLYLTDRDRRYLARMWGKPHHSWSSSDTALTRNSEDGLGAAFADIYGDCAYGWNDKDASIEFAHVPGVPTLALVPKINTCLYIDRVARRVRADMESERLAPWNRPRR